MFKLLTKTREADVVVSEVILTPLEFSPLIGCDDTPFRHLPKLLFGTVLLFLTRTLFTDVQWLMCCFDVFLGVLDLAGLRREGLRLSHRPA